MSKLMRTPPISQMFGSEPDLSENVDSDGNFRQRVKRKRDDEIMLSIEEVKTLLTNSISQQNEKFEKIETTVREIKDQNFQLLKTIDFLSEKYEELKTKVVTLEEERNNCNSYIKSLEDRVESLEKGSRAASIELRNIPQSEKETKDGLLQIVKEIGTVLGVSVVDSDIRDVFRYNSKTAKHKPIIAEFSTITKKEKFMNSLKNSKKQKGEQLNTSKISVPGPSQPFYIAENLTTKNKRLLFQVRELVRSSNSKYYYYISHGNIFVRQNQTDGVQTPPATRINSEDDILKLRNTI